MSLDIGSSLSGDLELKESHKQSLQHSSSRNRFEGWIGIDHPYLIILPQNNILSSLATYILVCSAQRLHLICDEEIEQTPKIRLLAFVFE